MSYEPQVIADGSRGIYAPKRAAQQILALLKLETNPYAIVRGGTEEELRTIADSKPGEVEGEEALFETWDTLERDLILSGDGTTWTLMQDGDVFLIPEGYQMDQQ